MPRHVGRRVLATVALASTGLGLAAGPTAADVFSGGSDRQGSFVSLGAIPRVTAVKSAGWPATPEGAFVPVGPSRVLDSRAAIGVPTRTPLGAQQSMDVALAGRAGLPQAANLMAVVLNVTVVNPGADGYLSVYRAGSPRPQTSSLNFTRRTTVANLVTVPVSATGVVTIFNAARADTHVLADVAGYYLSASPTTSSFGSYFPAPRRLYDSRVESRPLGSGSKVCIAFDYMFDLTQYIRALAVNITAVSPSHTGYLTAWSGAGPRPATSTLNFVRSRTQANMAVVAAVQSTRLEPRGNIRVAEFCVLNPSESSTHLIVDLVGFYDDNTIGSFAVATPHRFAPLDEPVRIVDTRSTMATTTFGPGSTHVVTTPPGLLATNTVGLVSNLVAATPTSSTYLALPWALSTRTGTSTLNTVAGVTMANMALLWLTDGQFAIYNSQGMTDVLVDVVGTMQAYPACPLCTGRQAARG